MRTCGAGFAALGLLWAGLQASAQTAPPPATCAPSRACAIRLARAEADLARSEAFDGQLYASRLLSIAAALGESGAREEARATFDEARAAIRREDREGRRQLMQSLVGQLAYGGFDDEARNEAARLPEPQMRLDAFRDIALYQAHIGRLAEAQASAASAGADREQVLAALAESAAEAGRIEHAQLFAQGLTGPRSRSAAYAIVAAQIKAGLIDAALRAAPSFNDFARGALIEEIATAQIGSGDLESGLANLRSARDILLGSHDGLLREIHAKLLAEKFSAAGAVEDALALVPQAAADERGELLARIAADQALAGRWRQALHIVPQLETVPYGGEHRASALAAIAAGRVVSGETDWRVAFAEVSDPLLRQTTLQDAAFALARRGRTTEARSLLDEAARSAEGIAPRADADDGLRDVVETHIELGFLAEAAAWTSQIRDLQTRAGVLARLGGARAAAGDRSGARANFAEAFAAASQAGSSRAFFVEEEARTGLLPEALGHARLLPGDNEQHRFERNDALGGIANAYAESGRAEIAFEVVREIDRAIMRSDAYLEISLKLSQ